MFRTRNSPVTTSLRPKAGLSITRLNSNGSTERGPVALVELPQPVMSTIAMAQNTRGSILGFVIIDLYRPANGFRPDEVHKVLLRTRLLNPCSPRRRTSCNSEKRFESPNATTIELFVRVTSVTYLQPKPSLVS